MWGLGATSKTLLALAIWATPALAQTPARVVSINLCTDLLAIELAPDKLLAVSPLATDSTSSPIADQAAAFPATNGTAEDIFLMSPDLVLAGSFSERATVDLLRRLGIRVEVFPPAASLDDIRDQTRRMGALLGRSPKAEALLSEFDTALSALAPTTTDPPRAIAYFANGYSLGNGTLIDSVLTAAGLDNVATEMGIAGGDRVSLEDLVLASPDIIVTGERYPGNSRSEAILDHPAIAIAARGREPVVIPDRDWICGTPHIIAAITALAGAGTELR